MTILENDPGLGLLGTSNGIDSLFSLTSTKGERLVLNLLQVRQVTDVSHGISTSRQHNNDGLFVNGVIEDLLEAGCWGLQVLSTKLFICLDHHLNALYNPVGSKD